MTTKKDSRRDPRAKVLSMTVRYKSATVAEFIENHSYDVSRGGMFIKTTSPFPAGTLLKFEVRIAEEQKVMMGVGRVTWRRETERGTDKPAGMGVKFIKIGGESVELIQRVVEARHDAASSFEEGAADQGIRLSAPPEELRRRELASTVAPDEGSDRPTPFFPGSGSHRDGEVADPSMLMQSSELLRSALEATETGRSTRDSDAPEISAVSEPPEASSQPPDAAAVDRQPLPTGESDAEQDMDASEDDDSSDESTDDANGADEDDSDDISDSSERDSKQPKSKRGKKKNPKKKKKKFKYSNIPTGKEPDTQSGVTVAASEMLTTPPTRAAKQEAPAPKVDNTPFKVLLVALALTVVAGLYLLNNKAPVEPTPEPASKPAEAPPVATEAPSEPAPIEEVRPAEVAPDAGAAPTGTVAPARGAGPAGAAAPILAPKPVVQPPSKKPVAPRPAAPKPVAPKSVAPKPAQPQKPATPPPSKPVAPQPTEPKAPVPPTPPPPPKTPSAPTAQPSPPAVVPPKPVAPQPIKPAPAPESQPSKN